MSNKTKQLIIAALICSMNPIIADTELMDDPIKSISEQIDIIADPELINQIEAIRKQIEDIWSALEDASNQEDTNRCYNGLIEKYETLKEKAVEIANHYKTDKAEGSRAKSLEYEAYALLAEANIARCEAILEIVNNTLTETELEALSEDVSKKYEKAFEVYRESKKAAI